MKTIGKKDIKSLSPEELGEFLTALGEPGFRAKQVFSWLHQKGTHSFDEMTNLSKSLRKRLSQTAFLEKPALMQRKCSQIDGTVKVLRSFSGDACESVLMRYDHGNTACISVQAGCRMGCVFCASKEGGLIRNLTPAEMIDQVLLFEREEAPVSGVVLMGTGEPLDNYDNTLKFIRLVSHPDGMHIGQRHITLSTCGLADKIIRLAEEKLQITLSVSLHAADNDLRDRLMPVNRVWPLEKLLPACRIYFEKTGRRVSFEYVMIRGVNDTKACADRLLAALSGMGAHINLIPLNETGTAFSGSDKKTIEIFKARLLAGGANATVRRRLGPDIDAACGQLRAKRQIV